MNHKGRSVAKSVAGSKSMKHFGIFAAILATLVLLLSCGCSAGSPVPLVSQLRRGDNLQDIVKRNPDKVVFKQAYGKFDTLAALLNNHQLGSLEIKFSWRDSSEKSFICVNGNVRAEGRPADAKLQSLIGKSFKSSLSELSKLCGDSDVNMSVKGDGLVLNDGDLVGDGRLDCVVDFGGGLGFIKTRGSKVVSWVVRDYEVDRVYESDTNDANWPF